MKSSMKMTLAMTVIAGMITVTTPLMAQSHIDGPVHISEPKKENAKVSKRCDQKSNSATASKCCGKNIPGSSDYRPPKEKKAIRINVWNSPFVL